MYTPTSILPARIVRSLKGSKRASKRSSANDKPPVTDELLSSVFEADEGSSCFDDFEEITYDEVLPDLDHETSTLDTRSLSPLTPRPEISTPFALSPHTRSTRSKSVSHTLPELPLSRSYSRSSLPLSRQNHSRSRLHLAVASTDSLLSEFPRPPAHVPGNSSRHVTLLDPLSTIGACSLVIPVRVGLIHYLPRIPETSFGTGTGPATIAPGSEHTASVSTVDPSILTIYHRTV